MALTEEQLQQQLNILATKTSDNSLMVFSALSGVNKGLDPSVFSGNNTKIVNAINKLAKDITALKNDVSATLNKVNEVMLDTSSTENAAFWEETKELMGKDTVIEGLRHMLESNLEHKILGLQPDDEGKMLSVGIDDAGNPTVIAVDAPTGGGGGVDGPVDWEDISNRPMVANNLIIDDDSLSLMSNNNEEIATVNLVSNDDIDEMINSLD